MSGILIKCARVAGQLVVGLALLAAGGCAALVGARRVSADAPAPTTFHVIAVGGERRGFLLHRPPNFAARGPLPVIIALHGSSANANVVMDESGLDPIADSIGALVVYPNGTGGIPYVRLFWNYEDCCGVGHRMPDEAAFVRALVDTLDAHFAIDRRRIGLIGFSDSGTLAYVLACQPTPLSAIGVISGDAPATPCAPRPPLATLVFHGTADRNTPYGQTAQRVAAWARQSGCRPTRVDTTAVIVRAEYADCDRRDMNVTLYTIVDGRHAWPGGRASWRFAPAPSTAVDASRLFADFVLRHPRAAAP